MAATDWMDIHVRRMTNKRSQNRALCTAGVFRLRDIFWRGLGQECPSYSNRSVDDSDFWTDFDERIVDFRTDQTKYPTCGVTRTGERHASACRYIAIPAVGTRAKNRGNAE